MVEKLLKEVIVGLFVLLEGETDIPEEAKV